MKKYLFPLLALFLQVQIVCTAATYYVSIDGEDGGAGSSWSDALSPANFFSKLPNAESGSIFYVEGGVYVFNGGALSINKNVTISGGYYNSGKRDLEGHPTVFSADLSSDDEIVRNVADYSLLRSRWWKNSNTEKNFDVDDLSIGHTDDNLTSLFEIKGASLVRFDGVCFKGAKTSAIISRSKSEVSLYLTNCDFYASAGGVVDLLLGNAINIDNCSFRQNCLDSNLPCVRATSVTTLRIANSLFEENGCKKTGTACVYLKNGTIYNTSFIKNQGSTSGAILSQNSIALYNSLFVGNYAHNYCGALNCLNGAGTIQNCFFFNCRSNKKDSNVRTAMIHKTESNGKMDLIGNIFVGEGVYIKKETDSNVMSRNNIFTMLPYVGENEYLEIDASDRVVPMKDMKHTFSCASYWDENEPSNVPNITTLDMQLIASEINLNKVEGKGYSLVIYYPILFEAREMSGSVSSGRNKCIALVKDTLPDGKSIRFPLSLVDYKRDAIGKKRYENTCIGPYELCPKDTIFLKDTIFAGKPFLDGKYYKVGLHDSIFENLTDQNGCDSVVMHTLLVKPSPTSKKYYVKTSGNGNGENWEDALSPEDFALYFSLVDDDVTFHIAKGTYYPMYPNPEVTKYTKDDYTFYTTKRVNLVGGYSLDPEMGEVPNPKLNETVLSGDLASRARSYNVIVMKPQSAGEVSIRGIVLDRSMENPSTQDGLLLFNPETNGTKLLLDSCVFKNGSKALNLQSGGADIRNCLFDSNYDVFVISKSEDVKISCCEFELNSRILYSFTDGNIEFTNSYIRIYSVDESSLYKISDTANPIVAFRNNTISGGLYLRNSVKCEMVGNLIWGNFAFENPQNVVSNYNVYFKDGYDKAFMSRTDKEFSSDDFGQIFGLYGNYGGFTNTYALVNDKSQTGESIRFPLSATTVSEDQRGMKRLSKTCAGSYELCTDTIFKNDTIKLGDSFLGKTYDKVGIHDSIFEYLPVQNDCETIVMHTLLVKPSPTTKNYYVKTSGNGNGENWKEALSPEDFALYFSLVDDDVTFHIAKGEYHPIYLNLEEKKYDERHLAFYTNKRVNLEGGYSADPKEGEAPDPANNATVLSGELEGEHSLKNIIVEKPQSAGSVVIRGIVFEKCQSADNSAQEALVYFNPEAQNASLMLDNCIFRDGARALNMVGGRANMKNCVFENNSYTLSLGVSGETTISNCTFDNSNSSISFFSDANLEISNSTFHDYGIISLSGRNQIPTVTFRNNTMLGNGFLLNSVECELLGNIIGNMSIPSAPSVSSYNLYLQGEEEKEFLSGTDKSASSFESIVETELGNHGGFTPTFALLNDQLPNGTSIRMPLSATTVTVDQRGVERLSETCAGSYEIPCLKKTKVLEDEAFVGSTYTFGTELDGVLTEEGTFEYTQTLKTVEGCDSVVRLQLTVKCPEIEKNLKVSIQSGEKYSFATLFKDSIFVKRGTFTFTDKLKNQYGCDSIVNLTLSVGCEAKTTNLTADATVGKLFTYKGVCTDTLFKKEGTALVERTFKAVSGCDSVVRLTVTVKCPEIEKNLTASIQSGEKYSFATLFKDSIFVKRGTFTFTDKLKNQYGCDSIVNLTLSVGCEAKTTNLTANATVDEPFTYEGLCTDTLFKKEGTALVEKTFKMASGCDSIVRLTVTVTCPEIEKNLTASIQSGEKYSFATLFKDSVFVESGTFTFTDKLKNQYGCDSIVNLTLSVGCEAKTTNLTADATVGKLFTYKGVCTDTLFKKEGTALVERIFKAASGCDSIVRLTVTVTCPEIEKNLTASIQSGEKYSFATLFKDSVFVKSGTFTFTDKLKNQYGCDSIVNLTLSVGCEAKTTNLTANATVGKLFTYKGVCTDTLFKKEGTALVERTFKAVSGCDSIIRLTVTVTCPEIEKNLTASIQSGEKYSFATLFKDSVFVESGTFTFTDKLKNQYGCDSVVNLTLSVGCEAKVANLTANATVGKLFSYEGVCTDTLFKKEGAALVERIFKAVSGCDSIVRLTVTVTCPEIEKNLTASIQSGEKYSFATLFKDSLFVESGTFTFTDKLKNQYGCDSIVNLSLSVGCEAKEVELSAKTYAGIPFSYEGVCSDTIFESAGQKLIEKRYLAISGCDSIVKLIVSVEKRDSFYYRERDAVCEGSNYKKNGWDLDLTGLPPFIYEYSEKIGQSDKTDTFKVLTLVIQDKDHVLINDFTENPTICKGGNRGEVSFAMDRNASAPLAVQLYDGSGALLNSYDSEKDADYVTFSDMAPGEYTVKITPTMDDYCLVDTTFSIKVEDAEPVSITGVDTIYTICLSDPTAQCELELSGYLPSLTVKMNERTVQSDRNKDVNCYLEPNEEDPSKAIIHIDSLGVGVYLFDVFDDCENSYTGLHKLVVEGPAPLKLERLAGKTDLLCNNSNDGTVTLQMTGGSLLSRLNVSMESGEEVYPMTGDTTIVVLENLEGGTYPITYLSGVENCGDQVLMDLKVNTPEPLKADLMVNGIVCQDAVITAYTSGESGLYSYRWVKPSGDTVSTSGNTLSNVGAGRYECIVTDKKGCAEVSSFAMVSPLASLSPLKLISASVDETCFDSDNAKIGVLYYNNNEHQAVTCTLERVESGEIVKSVTSMLYWGIIILDNVKPGTYVIRLRYGTENCNLSLDEVTETLVVKAKQKPLIIEEPVVADATCLSTPNGSITLNVSGWENGYKANLNGSVVTPVSVSKDSVALFTFSSLKGGKYKFEVEDDCKEQDASTEITVNQIEPYKLTQLDGLARLECAHDNTGYVRFNVSGGYYGHNRLYTQKGDLDQVIDRASTILYDGLTKGSYRVIYESAVEGCPDRAVLNYEVDGPNPLKMDLQLNGVHCPNEGLVAKTSGESGPYLYEWSFNGRVRRTYSSKCPFTMDYGNTYYCKVKDEKGCDSVEKSVTIPAIGEFPELVVKSVGHAESCYQGKNGYLTMNVSADGQIPYGMVVTCGYAPYGTTNFKNYSSTVSGTWRITSPKNLAPGKYVVRAHYGAEGCEMGGLAFEDIVEVDALQPLKIDTKIDVRNVTCLKNPNGGVSFNVNGWSSSHKAYLIQDSYRTVNILFFTLRIPISSSKQVAPSSVEGQMAKFNLTGLEAGSYRLLVEDACGNKSNAVSFKVEEVVKPYKINVLSKKDQLKCNYSEDAMVTLQVTGGNPNANTFYQVGKPAITITKDTVMTFSGLSAGTYGFHYLSTEEGCTDHVSYGLTVAPTHEFKQSLSLQGEPCKDQKLEALISGGEAPYTVVWKTDEGVSVETDKDGLYELTAAGTGSFYCETTDQNGCVYLSDTVKAVLIDAENMTLSIDKLLMEKTKCYASEDGVVKVAFSGNTAQSTLEARLLAGSELKQTKQSNAAKDTFFFEGLAYGKYDVEILYADAAECSLGANTKGSISVERPEKLNVTLSHVPVVCDVEHGGKAVAKAEGGIAPYTFEWRNELDEAHGINASQSIDTLKGLALDSSYYCVVRDSNDCELVSGLEKITKLTLKKLSVGSYRDTKTVLCSGQNNARAYVTLSERDERVPVKVSLKGEGTSSRSAILATDKNEGVVEGLAPGNYVVNVAYDDADACDVVFDTTITILPLDPLALSDVVMTHQVTCHNPANGGIKFEVSGWAETHIAAVVTNGDSLFLTPDSIKGQTAYFNEDDLLGGDYVCVADICENKEQKKTDLVTFDDYTVKVVAEKLKLRCSYTTDGFVEVELDKGNHKDNKYYLVKQSGSSWELASEVTYDVDLKEPFKTRYSNLSAGNYRVIFQSKEEDCKDVAYVQRTVVAPAPISFINAVKPAACKDVSSGAFAVTPYRYKTDVKYVKLDESENMAEEVVDKKTDQYNVFPGVVDLNFYMIEDGVVKDATAKLDTFMYSGGKDLQTGEETSSERVELKTPYKSMWEWKQDQNSYVCPKYWIGFESLPSYVFMLKVTDDSACVFVDTLKVSDPKYGELKIDSVRFDADDASCHADHRRMEIFVKGGWGKYLYSISPLNYNEEDEDDFMSQTYNPGDSTWAENGKGYYRSYILDPGLYKVAVVDSFGCKDSLQQAITVKAKIDVKGTVKADPCGGSESEITVRPSVASNYAVYEPYGYAVRYEDTRVGDTLAGPSTEKVLSGIPMGKIGVFVYDGNGCSGYATFNVNGTNESFVPMTAYSMRTEPVKCHGSEEGELVFKAYGAYPPYVKFYMDDEKEPMDEDRLVFAELNEKLEKTGVTYHLTADGLNPEKKDTFCLTNLKGGKHTLTIVDSKNCKQKLEYSIEEPAALSITQLKASPVCPNSTEGKISVKVAGGTPPYEYGFLDESPINYQKSEFLAAPQGVAKQVSVRDANGCLIKSQSATVNGTFDASKIEQSCVVSTWQDFDDVLVFIDNSYVPSGYDSTRFELDESDFIEGVSYKVVNPIFFTYGIPDTLEGVKLWNGDSIKGPLWGIPSDIVAGVKDDKHYQEEQARINASMDAYKADLKKYNESQHKSESDSIKLANTYSLLMQQWRVNCTEKMLTETFISLVDASMEKRMTFIQFNSSKDLSSLMKSSGKDSVLFEYGFRHILYVSGCDLTTEHQSIKVAKEGISPYESLLRRDLISVYATPNPVDANEIFTVTVKLSSKVDFEVQAYNMLGAPVTETAQKFEVADENVVWTEENEFEGKVYVVQCEMQLPSTSVVLVRTAKDQASTTVVVTGAPNSGN